MNNQSVCIIDDNDSFRQSTSWLLSGMGHDVTEFSSPIEGLEALTTGIDCECLLVDVRMPDMSGLDVHDKLIEQGCSVPVVYMTGHGDVALAVEAMNKGAVTFLEKPLDVGALEAALLSASELRKMRTLFDRDEKQIQAFRVRLETLTPREVEVMRAIVDGNANKVIAYDLGISQKTVELHRSRVMKKLLIRSPQELVKMVLLSR